MINDKEAAALKRVTKKLSAMRKTLPKVERQMLDYMILGKKAEVEGHRAAVSQAAITASAKKGSKRAGVAAAEVEGHKLVDNTIWAKKDKPAAQAEVMGHQMRDQAAASSLSAASSLNAVQSSVVSAVRAAVSFNAATSAYVVSDK